jgi:hypothetical protein
MLRDEVAGNIAGKQIVRTRHKRVLNTETGQTEGQSPVDQAHNGLLILSDARW